MKAKIPFLFLLAVLPLASFAHAQTHRATVRGTVTNISQTPLSGATLKLVQEETGAVRTATSSAEGEFVISSLPSGAYRLEVESAGYKKYLQNLVLQVSQVLRVDPKLRPK